VLRRFVDSGHFYEPIGYPESPVVDRGDGDQPGASPAGELLPDLPFLTGDGTAADGSRVRLRDEVGASFLFVHLAPDVDAAVAVRGFLCPDAGAIAVLPAAADKGVDAEQRPWIATDVRDLAPERFYPEGLPPCGSILLVRPDGYIASRHELEQSFEARDSHAWLDAARGVNL
jgi:hypothetical protein